jgi:hypothetical protein
MGALGRMMKEVFVSSVTKPAAFAAGMLVEGKGEGVREGPEGEDEKVFTVRISVLRGKLRIDSM